MIFEKVFKMEKEPIFSCNMNMLDDEGDVM
jgi:hypothetical protein